jgi:hypothetical protein
MPMGHRSAGVDDPFKTALTVCLQWGGEGERNGAKEQRLAWDLDGGFMHSPDDSRVRSLNPLKT